MLKCEKCSREFCSTINYRRHIRVHRRSLNIDKVFLCSSVLIYLFSLVSSFLSEIYCYNLRWEIGVFYFVAHFFDRIKIFWFGECLLLLDS